MKSLDLQNDYHDLPFHLLRNQILKPATAYLKILPLKE